MKNSRPLGSNHDHLPLQPSPSARCGNTHDKYATHTRTCAPSSSHRSRGHGLQERSPTGGCGALMGPSWARAERPSKRPSMRGRDCSWPQDPLAATRRVRPPCAQKKTPAMDTQRRHVSKPAPKGMARPSWQENGGGQGGAADPAGPESPDPSPPPAKRVGGARLRRGPPTPRGCLLQRRADIVRGALPIGDPRAAARPHLAHATRQRQRLEAPSKAPRGQGPCATRTPWTALKPSLSKACCPASRASAERSELYFLT